MSAPNTVEADLLLPANKLLDVACHQYSPRAAANVRFRILERTASLLGGFAYDQIFGPTTQSQRAQEASVANQLAAILRILPFHPGLGLAALARPPLTASQRRTSGSYFTDFRLAMFLAGLIRYDLEQGLPILDPACGSATLLVATVLAISKGNPTIVRKLLGDTICGSDLSIDALRGAFLSLASLTNDDAVLCKLRGRLRQADSLLSGIATWADVAPHGFGLIIGNPPWEKLKLTRHEWLLTCGQERHYGDDYPHVARDKELLKARADLSSYVAMLGKNFSLQGRGEYDLFKLFCELSFCLVAPAGELALLVPAGLIRSQGTQELRRWLMKNATDVEIAVIENRARFFEIDTRFKFLAVHVELKTATVPGTVKLLQTTADTYDLTTQQVTSIPKSMLCRIRPDYSIPEVRSTAEWQLFVDFCRKGIAFGDQSGPWAPTFMREVDMTREKACFLRGTAMDQSLPLIEGRMVHQYRYAAKRYISGTGRRSIWEPTLYDDLKKIGPQFRFPMESLPDAVSERVARWRVGFCDITGQTNERTMLASRIPAGVVCGNKVPTIIFELDPANENLAYCWLAIVNSFVFDWMLRRIVTTTVNYFLLMGIPFPKFNPLSSQKGRRLAMLSKTVSEDQTQSSWEKAEQRAEIEALVIELFDRDTRDMEMVLADFPLLDRAQPCLPGENRSSITRDLVLLRTAQRVNGVPQSRVDHWHNRVEHARELGATPFIPSHLASDYD